MGPNSNTNGPRPFRLMVFDSPRTTCQVFYKLFQSHPQLGWGRFYHGFNGYQLCGPNRLSVKLRHSPEVGRALDEYWVKPYLENEAANAAYPPVLELAQQNFVDAVGGTEKDGKTFFGKEHILCLLKQGVILSALRRGDKDTSFPPLAANPTYIPDDLLKTLQPIFIIRRPQLMEELTKMTREDEDLEFQIKLKWTRILYDYFEDQLGIKPVILDSEDFVYQTEAVTNKLCAMYGLIPNGVKETWDPVSKEHWPKSAVAKTYVGHMLGSKGMERGEKPPPPNLDKQTAKWAGKHGEKIADGLRKRIEGEVPAYEYLRARKLNP